MEKTYNNKLAFAIIASAVLATAGALITTTEVQNVDAKSLKNHDGIGNGIGCSSSSMGAQNANTFCNGLR